MWMMSCRMSRWRVGLILLSLAMVPLGCAPMRGAWDTGLSKDDLSTEDRLWHIVFPLSVAAAEHCVFKREETYGFFLEFPTASATDVAQESSHAPARVRYINAQLPAGKAGMAIGDVIIAINGSSVVSLPVAAVREQIDRLTRAKIQPLSLRLMRNGRGYDVDLWAVPSCRMQVKVVDSPVINAMADGSNIVVSSGLLGFVQSPDQLAWVLAHEVGHHAMEHAEKSRLHLTLNRLLSSMGEDRLQTLEQIDLERQADLFAADLTVRAGFDLRAARQFLRRIQLFDGQGFSQTHPTTQERLAALDRLIDRRDHQQNGVKHR